MKSIRAGAFAPGLFVVMTIASAPQPPQPGQAPTGLRIRVLEGEDAVNIVQQRSAVRPLVEVRDTNDQPVAGVIVQFTLRRVGNVSTASFANGQTVATVITDVSGRAAAPPMQALGSGPVRIDVQVSYRGQTANATVNQTNYPTVQSAAQAGRVPSPIPRQPVPPTVAPGATLPGGVAATVAGVSAAVVTGALAVKESTQTGPTCSSQSFSFTVDFDAALDACIGDTNSPQCTETSRRAAGSLGAWCSCQGAAGVDTQLRAENSSLALLRTLAAFPTGNVQFPASCSL